MADLFPNGASGSSVRSILSTRIGQEFNVKSYGAVGDGVTDDTDAINAALAAAWNAGGGVVYFPAGHYVVSGDFDPVTNGILTFPQDGTYTGTPRRIVMVGASRGRMNSVYNAAASGGVLLDFTNAPAGSGSYPAALSCAPFVLQPQIPLADWNDIDLFIDEIAIMMPSNPTFGAVNMSNALRGSVGDGFSAYTITSGGVFVQPTHDSFGIYFPQTQNNVFNQCGAAHIVGFDVGLIGGEHLHLCGRPYIGYCNTGVLINPIWHAITGWVAIENCTEFFRVADGAPQAIIDLHLQSENSPGHWYSLASGSGVIDSGNVLRGRLKYQISQFNPSGSFIEIPITGATRLNLYNLCTFNGGGGGTIPTDYIAYWPLSTDLLDETETYDLTGVGTPTFGSGALILNGTTQYAKNDTLDFASMSWTVCGWCKADTADIKLIASQHGLTSGSDRTFNLYRSAEGAINASLISTGGAAQCVTADGVTNESDYFFVRLSANAVTRILTLQVNGGTPITDDWIGDQLTCTQPFALGVQFTGAANTAEYFWDGSMTKWRVFDRVITSGEYTAIYDAGPLS